jgi:UDP-glucose 4-epimerase
VELVIGDLRDADMLSASARGVDAVVHIAALLNLFDSGRERDADYQALNVESTRVLAGGAARLIYFSTSVVYGSGGPFTEDSPVASANTYARTKLEAERLALDAGGTALRLAAVYGARLKGSYESLVRAIESHRFVPIGRGDNHRTLVYDNDVAEAVKLVLDSTTAAGKNYTVTDGQTHALRDIIAVICRALGRKPPRTYLPVAPLRIAGGLVPRAGRMLEKYLEDVRVDGSRIQRELGFRPRYGLAA